MKLIRLLLTALLIVTCGASNATGLDERTMRCYAEASARYRLPHNLLLAISYVESRFRPAAMNSTHANRSGTVDIGMMQINSSWLRKLAAWGISRERLYETCQNIMVGSWVLAHHMAETGGGWNGVAAYNASCRTLSRRGCFDARWDYTSKVARALEKLDGGQIRSMPPLVQEAINISDAGGSRSFNGPGEVTRKRTPKVGQKRADSQTRQTPEPDRLVTLRFAEP